MKTIEEIIKEQEKEFDEISYRQIFLLDGKRGTLKNTIVYESIKNWHASSIKQILEALVEREIERETTYRNIEPIGAFCVEFADGWDNSKQDTISHLKSLIEKI